MILLRVVWVTLLGLGLSSEAFAKENARDVATRACTSQVRIELPCTSGNMYQDAVCEKTFIKTTAEILANKHGSLNAIISKYGISRNIGWPTITHNWLQLEKTLVNDPEAADIVVWVLATPYSFAEGKYDPFGYIYFRGSNANLSVNWISDAINSGLGVGLNMLPPLYEEFLKYFFSGDTDGVQNIIQKIRPDFPTIRSAFDCNKFLSSQQ